MGFLVFLPIALALEIENEVFYKEFGSIEKSHDKDKIRAGHRKDGRRGPDGSTLLVDDGGQSSQDHWKRPASHGKWKEFFNVVEELGTLLKDKKGTWVETHQRKYGKRNRSPCRDRRIQNYRKS